MRWSSTGTHEGDLAGIPPTHKPMRTEGINIWRVVDGRVVEGWLDRRPVSRDELGIDQDPDELVDPQVSVLVTERIESRVDDRHRAGQLRRHVFGRREECRVVGGQVGREEVPGGACLLKLLVEAVTIRPDFGPGLNRLAAAQGWHSLQVWR